MSTSVSNISKWTTNNSWPFLWPFYFHPPLQHELTLEINMSSPWKNHPPHECFINRIYQQDIPANPRRPTCCQPKKTNITHNYVIWTNRLNCPNCPNRLNKPSEPSEPIWTNPSKPHQRLIHIEIPNNPI